MPLATGRSSLADWSLLVGAACSGSTELAAVLSTELVTTELAAGLGSELVEGLAAGTSGVAFTRNRHVPIGTPKRLGDFLILHSCFSAT